MLILLAARQAEDTIQHLEVAGLHLTLQYAAVLRASRMVRAGVCLPWQLYEFSCAKHAFATVPCCNAAAGRRTPSSCRAFAQLSCEFLPSNGHAWLANVCKLDAGTWHKCYLVPSPGPRLLVKDLFEPGNPDPALWVVWALEFNEGLQELISKHCITTIWVASFGT